MQFYGSLLLAQIGYADFIKLPSYIQSAVGGDDGLRFINLRLLKEDMQSSGVLVADIDDWLRDILLKGNEHEIKRVEAVCLQNAYDILVTGKFPNKEAHDTYMALQIMRHLRDPDTMRPDCISVTEKYADEVTSYLVHALIFYSNSLMKAGKYAWTESDKILERMETEVKAVRGIQVNS